MAHSQVTAPTQPPILEYEKLGAQSCAEPYGMSMQDFFASYPRRPAIDTESSGRTYPISPRALEDGKFSFAGDEQGRFSSMSVHSNSSESLPFPEGTSTPACSADGHVWECGENIARPDRGFPYQGMSQTPVIGPGKNMSISMPDLSLDLSLHEADLRKSRSVSPTISASPGGLSTGASSDESPARNRAKIRERLTQGYKIPGPDRYVRGADPRVKSQRRTLQNRLSGHISRELARQKMLSLEKEACNLEQLEQVLIAEEVRVVERIRRLSCP